MDIAITNNRYALNQLGRFDEALNLSIRATELLPKNPVYRMKRAVDTYLSSGKKRFEDSIEACRQLKIAIQLGYKQNESERKLFKNCS